MIKYELCKVVDGELKPLPIIADDPQKLWDYLDNWYGKYHKSRESAGYYINGCEVFRSNLDVGASETLTDEFAIRTVDDIS